MLLHLPHARAAPLCALRHAAREIVCVDLVQRAGNGCVLLHGHARLGQDGGLFVVGYQLTHKPLCCAGHRAGVVDVLQQLAHVALARLGRGAGKLCAQRCARVGVYSVKNFNQVVYNRRVSIVIGHLHRVRAEDLERVADINWIGRLFIQRLGKASVLGRVHLHAVLVQ